jgi:lysophospholipase L1-like esterase
MVDATRVAATRTTHRSKLRRGCIASSISLFVALFCAELFVRAWIGAPRTERLPLLLVRLNRTRGFEMVPHQTHYTYEHEVHVNSLGFRGPELPAEKGAELRVLCLGDSLVYGQGVADDQTIPAHMERLAAAKHPLQPFRAVNAGVRAYATHQELALLEELGEKVEPDVVALFWYHNDFEERDIPSTVAKLEKTGPITFDVSDPLEGWLLARWRLEQVVRKSALAMELFDVVRARTSTPMPKEFFEAGFERLDGYLDRYVAYAKQRGVRAIFVRVPDAQSIRRATEFDALDHRAMELARAKGLEVVDALPELQRNFANAPALPVIPYDGHYKGPANEAIARAVVAALLP